MKTFIEQSLLPHILPLDWKAQIDPTEASNHPSSWIFQRASKRCLKSMEIGSLGF